METLVRMASPEHLWFGVCVFFFGLAGRARGGSGLLYGALSVGFWFGVPFLLGSSSSSRLSSALVGQCVLFVLLTVWSLLRRKPQ